MVCSRPACILLACVGFGQETRANAPSPTSNGCQAPLNVTGWLESRGRRGGGGVGVWGGVREGEARAPLAKKRHPATAELISVAWIQLRRGPLRRTRCGVSSSVPLCVWYGLGQREALVQEGGHCTAQTHHKQAFSLLHFVLLTASFRARRVQPPVQDWTGSVLLCLGHSGSCRLFLLLPAAVFIGFCLILPSAN